MPLTRSEAATGFARSFLTKYWASDKPLELELGGALSAYTLAYRTWGRLSPNGDNVVVVCHALTGSADVDDWWASMLGPGKALDPTRDFIVCSNVLGGCYGSTGAMSVDLTGCRYGKSFPSLTIRDQVRAQMRLADALGLRGIELVVGGSMGGLHTLEWALLDTKRVRSIAVIAASACHSAWCASWSEAQRMALHADASFRGGEYSADAPPVAGLRAARAVAMTTYRSPLALERRYGPDASNVTALEGHANARGELEVRNWLRHHAESFVARFDANCYMTLIDAMDRHDIGRGRGGVISALRSMSQPALVVAVSSDGLYVPSEQLDMSHHMPNCEFVQMTSEQGHDGFLIDAAKLELHVAHFRERQRNLPHRRKVSAAPGNPQ